MHRYSTRTLRMLALSASSVTAAVVVGVPSAGADPAPVADPAKTFTAVPHRPTVETDPPEPEPTATSQPEPTDPPPEPEPTTGPPDPEPTTAPPPPAPVTPSTRPPSSRPTPSPRPSSSTAGSITDSTTGSSNSGQSTLELPVTGETAPMPLLVAGSAALLIGVAMVRIARRRDS